MSKSLDERKKRVVCCGVLRKPEVFRHSNKNEQAQNRVSALRFHGWVFTVRVP